MEEIDAVASATSVQATTAIWVSSLYHEKLSEGTHHPSFARTPSTSHGDVLWSDDYGLGSIAMRELLRRLLIMKYEIVMFNKVGS